MDALAQKPPLLRVNMKGMVKLLLGGGLERSPQDISIIQSIGFIGGILIFREGLQYRNLTIPTSR